MRSKLRALSMVAGALGALGAVLCAGAMVLTITGILGLASAGVGAATWMGRMRSAATWPGPAQPSGAGWFLGWALSFLVLGGPVILVLSVVAMAVAFALRRSAGVAPVLIGGAVMYWGMYAQSRLPVMYVSIALGLLAWVATAANARIRAK